MISVISVLLVMVTQARHGRSLFFHTNFNETYYDIKELVDESAYHTSQAAQNAVKVEYMKMKSFGQKVPEEAKDEVQTLKP